MNDQEYLSGVWQKVDEKEMANQIVEYMDTLPKKIGPREFAACLFKEIGIMNLFRNTDLFKQAGSKFPDRRAHV